MIGIVRRNDDFGRVGVLGRVKSTVRFLKIDLRQEWLMRLQIVPAAGIERLAVVAKVPVGLAGAVEAEMLGKLTEIGREITGVAHPIREHTNAIGQSVAVVAMRAMIVRADRRLKHAGHERAATGRADGGGREES